MFVSACVSNLENITAAVVRLTLLMQTCVQLNIMQTGCNSATTELSLNSLTTGINVCVWICYLDNDMSSQVTAFHPLVSVFLILIVIGSHCANKVGIATK